jgi:hypothetical protein
MKVWMGDPPHMPQLRENPAAGAVDGVGDRLPTGHLLGRMDARRSDVADTLPTRLSRLGDDQPRRCTLRVIGRGKRIWDIVLDRAAARHRSHHDAVGKFEVAQSKGREKIFWCLAGSLGGRHGRKDGGLISSHGCFPLVKRWCRT